MIDLDGTTLGRIVANIHDGLYAVDRERRIVYWNRAAERISGYSAEEVVGRRCADNILTHVDCTGSHLCLARCPLSHTMEDGQDREQEVFLHHKDGFRVPVSVRASPIFDNDGRITGAVELFSPRDSADVHEMRMAELRRLAMVDNVTGIPNRHYLERELSSRYRQARDHGAAFGLIIFDIDHFKQFNDTWGHATGDRVLSFVARTLSNHMRPFDVCGRWGGEEFLVLLPHTTREGLAAAAERLRTMVATAYLTVDETHLSVTVTGGAAMYRAGDEPATLIARADERLYRGKAAGRDRVVVSDDEYDRLT